MVRHALYQRGKASPGLAELGGAEPRRCSAPFPYLGHFVEPNAHNDGIWCLFTYGASLSPRPSQRVGFEVEPMYPRVR